MLNIPMALHVQIVLSLLNFNDSNALILILFFIKTSTTSMLKTINLNYLHGFEKCLIFIISVIAIYLLFTSRGFQHFSG